MACNCGNFDYVEIPSGGLKVGGIASVDSSVRKVSGGLLAGGTATVSTNQPFEGFDSVYHLPEQGNGTANEYKNSCFKLGGIGDSGLNTDWVPTQAKGVWYLANSFDGNDYITLPVDTCHDNNPFTVSLWAKLTGKFLERTFFTRGADEPITGQGWSVRLWHTFGNQPAASVQVIGSTNWKTYTVKGSALSLNCWFHLAAVWTPGTSLRLYVDGVLSNSVAITETVLVPSTKGDYIGRTDNYAFAAAVIQEVRFAPVARSADWILAEFNDICPNNFYTVGTEESTIP